jgi:hypothetical protein
MSVQAYYANYKEAAMCNLVILRCILSLVKIIGLGGGSENHFETRRSKAELVVYP